MSTRLDPEITGLSAEPPPTDLPASLPSGVTDMSPLDDNNAHLFLLPFFFFFAFFLVLAARFELVAAVGVFSALTSAFSPKKMTLRWRWRFIAMAITLACALAPVIVLQGSTRMNKMADRIEKDGPGHLDTVQLTGLYFLSRLFVIGGSLKGYPEAAQEHDGMHHKGPAQRAMKNPAFPSQSPRVQAIVKGLAKSLTPAQHKAGKPITLGPKLVVFDYAKDDLRWALALNPIELRVVATPRDSRWRLAVEGRVKVTYPKGAKAPLGVTIMNTPLVFRETLFWALEQRGWLRPYVAVWRWTAAH